MLVLRAVNLTMEYGHRLIFDIPELELHSGDRVGLVGRNGAGKTTLLSALAGFLEPAKGSVTALVPVAIIPQFSEDTDGTAILEWQREFWGIPKEAMSGGEKTRLLIARAMGRESGAMQKSKSVRKTPARMGNSEARLHRREATEISQKLARASKTIEHRLEKLDVKEKPREAARVRLQSREVQGPGARFALRAESLSFSYPGGPAVLEDLSLSVETGARLSVTGANGSGKTTLLNCLYAGGPEIREAPGVKKGYFRQDLKLLDDGKTLLENVLEGAAVPAQEARKMLARVLLPAESLGKKAAVLSGGEKAKAALVKLLASEANLLLLDEPSNFLDAYALEGLEEMIESFPGTIVFASHNRYFIENVADSRLEL